MIDTQMINNIVISLSKILVFYFFTLNTIYLILLVIGIFSVKGYFRKRKFAGYEIIKNSPLTPPVSIIVPAYNEEKTIVDITRSLLALSYPHYEVIVVNDGSKDRTLNCLKEAFELTKINKAIKIAIPSQPINSYFVSKKHTNLTIIDKDNGGKADALNAGVNFAHYPLVCTIDADTILEEKALLRIVKPIVEYGKEVAAVGGIVRIANGCSIKNSRIAHVHTPKNLLAGFQVIEYLRAFLTGRTGWSALNSLLIISGAFGLFRKDLVVKVGGFAPDTIGEDAEIVVRLHRHLKKERSDYKILFTADPICWTQVPENLRTLLMQRKRWHIGLIETLTRHIKILFNPRYGKLGFIALPYFFFFEMLGPFVELLGFAAIIYGLGAGIVDFNIFASFMAVSVLYGILLSMGAILVEEFSYNRYETWYDLTLLLLYAVLENFGYRQFLSLVRAMAFFDWLLGRRKWVPSQRRKFAGVICEKTDLVE